RATKAVSGPGTVAAVSDTRRVLGSVETLPSSRVTAQLGSVTSTASESAGVSKSAAAVPAGRSGSAEPHATSTKGKKRSVRCTPPCTRPISRGFPPRQAPRRTARRSSHVRFLWPRALKAAHGVARSPESPSMRGEGVFHDLAVLHHEAHPFELARVGERIA